jgi:hypothetical protein
VEPDVAEALDALASDENPAADPTLPPRHEARSFSRYSRLLHRCEPQWKTQGIDKAAVLSALFPDVEDEVAAGDLSEVVRLRRMQDQTRKPRGSDTPDEWHLQFAVHADVFTVDGNVAHVMRSVSGRPLPIRGRRASSDGERVYVYRSGQLASVARALLALSGDP